MFSLVLSVNGVEIAELKGKNLGVRDEAGLTEYSFRYRRFAKVGYSPLAASGTLWHRREEGLERLVARILERAATEGVAPADTTTPGHESTDTPDRPTFGKFE
jgi:hypothetical protein